MQNTEICEYEAPQCASADPDLPLSRADAADRFGGGRRAIAYGDMRWLVLDMIHAQPRHGYDIIKAIRSALDGRYSPSSGLIYPMLSVLETSGLIARADVGSRKVYSVTEQGAGELAVHTETIAQVRERVQALRANFRPIPPRVERALGELRRALAYRVLDGPLHGEAIDAIATALEEATTAIEGAMPRLTDEQS